MIDSSVNRGSVLAMNNQEQSGDKIETQSEKSGFTKFLIIILLLAVLAGAAWGAVKIVKNFPEAINSLASIADTVYNYNPEEKVVLSISTDRNVINAGEIVSIWWNSTNQEDSYFFSYTCQEGIAIDLQENENNEFVSIACDTKHKLNDNNPKIKVESEENRFSDVNFTIIQENKSKDILTEDSSKITVVNSTISDSVVIDDKEKTDIPSDTNQVEDTPKEDIGDKDESNQIVDRPKYEPSPEQQQPHYIYEIPVSDPNGRTDLVLSNLKTGYINDINIFIESKNTVTGFKNVLQFTVHNIGTKTSEDWIFEIGSPNTLFTSKDQLPLKPNERSTLFVQLPTISEKEFSNLSVLVETKNDANINNNYLKLTTN